MGDALDFTPRRALELEGPQECHFCGCTESHACVDEEGEPCFWVGPRVCSACFYAPIWEP